MLKASHSVEYVNPISHDGLAKDKRYFQIVVIRSSNDVIHEHGICNMLQKVKAQEHHKKSASKGVKIILAMGNMQDTANPQ